MIRETPRLRAAALAAAALAAMALGAGAAQATQVFSDNFNSENGGVAANPYTGFANWTVLSGAVTLNEGAPCDGGSGGCVGLDGRGGGGSEFEMSNSISYGVGSLVTLTYDIAGNHHDCSVCATDDEYEAGFLFSNIGETINDVTLDGQDVGPIVISTGIDLFGTGFPLPFNDPWTTHTVSFTATDAGTIKAHFRSFSTDGVGPLLDNVSVDVTGGVPEPASWALMIAGFGLAGAALRRRRSAVAA
ncbi:PEPxxWA-CTERM sorting domain-containing protein [Phenylobacterium sp.]|jgi:hypothetical protein|uniref:PEPxxWA-CTERM sorting domain-containing protein n=1 Tax=Phenylobacterium sp. TaxID=1871053 RepID=UPI002E32A624|nr:PEPxxWA-CTERM sorting domain-containing protein [Phenylobacterium sp.]HEX3366887.1 PEPxxWA-CTERM sorting domain-containing protein [Phenylobacterium sp.]